MCFVGWNGPIRKKKTKYNSRKQDYSGISFASKLEAAVYQELKLLEKAQIIRDIKVQDHVYLTRARILYIADFKAWDIINNRNVWYEAKGFSTDVWAIKKRLWKCYGPGPLHIYKGSYRKPILTESVIPDLSPE